MSKTKQSSTLLLVDDDPSIVRLLSTVLEREYGDEITIESLTDPLEARARIIEGGVDILVTDLEMPGIDGLELLRCAKQRSACTQVLFFTGHSSREALLEALELGATDYLIKPVDQGQLLELISQALGRQRRWNLALAETWRQRRKSTVHES
ncbi:MAG: response regulator [Planctomycetes bacterium]|nr:response regulator [Planctomycetota bacterium]